MLGEERVDLDVLDLGVETLDYDVELLLLFVIDSLPEMQVQSCQGWVLDDGVIAHCGKQFPVGPPPCKRRDHLFECAVRTERWAREYGWQLGMRVEPTREERKVLAKLIPKEQRFFKHRSERQAYSNAERRCVDP